MNERNLIGEQRDEDTEPTDEIVDSLGLQKEPIRKSVTHTGESSYRKKRLLSYLRRFRRVGPDRHIELLLSIAIVTFAFLQLIITCSNNRTTGMQAEQLVKGAKGIEDAAKSFSSSTANINAGMSNAVDKLNTQAKATQDQLTAFKEASSETAGTQILLGLPVIELGSSAFGRTVKLDEAHNAPQVWGVTQDYVNVGETRALSPQVETGWGDKLPDRHTRYQWNTRIWTRTTWAKNKTEQDLEVFSDAQLQEMLNMKPLYYYGKIRYRDVFPKTQVHRRRDHLFEFCLRVVEVNTKVPPFFWDTRVIPEGRCYDEKCADY